MLLFVSVYFFVDPSIIFRTTGFLLPKSPMTIIAMKLTTDGPLSIYDEL